MDIKAYDAVMIPEAEWDSTPPEQRGYVERYRKNGYVYGVNEDKTRERYMNEELEKVIAAEIRQAINDCMDVKKSVSKACHDCSERVINIFNEFIVYGSKGGKDGRND